MCGGVYGRGMPFPDRIERTVELGHPPSAVWAALTTAQGLAAWFGDSAEIDLRPGGRARIAWEDGAVHDLRVEHVDEQRAFAFTWQIDGMPADDLRRTLVEFTLEPVDGPEGSRTRLTVVETGFAQLSDDEYDAAYDDHATGWVRELGELADHLDAS